MLLNWLEAGTFGMRWRVRRKERDKGRKPSFSLQLELSWA
jgi:hypothetical protein